MDTAAVSKKLAALRIKGSAEPVHAVEEAAEEVPVALVYNGISHAVMLATPSDLEDFGLGFSLTEGIISDISDLYGTEIAVSEKGIRVEMDVASRCFMNLKEKRRTLAGRTGCGLCGTDSLDHAVRVPAPVSSDPRFTPDAIHAGFDKMEDEQILRRITGATHAAAWMAEDGSVPLMREDVGRHNALDKLIGAMARAHVSPAKGAVLVTSRASLEMVQKCGAAGIGLLAAVSAPTALAVRVAERANITLAGFTRRGAMTLYSHPERVIPGASFSSRG